MKQGLLLINLGTPKSTNKADIQKYLREFLMDKRVIDIPLFFRFVLVYGIIVPFRAQKSARAYELIWTDQGSPLLIHSKNLAHALQNTLGTSFKVALGMRYGSPSIAKALAELKECNKITILPLYPQYSSAATGSALEAAMNTLSTQETIPSLHIISDFYNRSDYISSQAQLIKQQLQPRDYLLFSYHGIPERQLLKSGCIMPCTGPCVSSCYRAQCFQTSSFLAQELQLGKEQYGTAFQSRLGKLPWIKPYTDEILVELAQKGVKHLTVTCPSFTTDCLETLEEIGMRAKEQWLQLGGQEFKLIPSLNSNEGWIKAIIHILDNV